jgi:hypothetical protein
LDKVEIMVKIVEIMLIFVEIRVLSISLCKVKFMFKIHSGLFRFLVVEEN